jgi:hypothetical protein
MQNAKLAYLLSTCHKFNEVFTNNILNQFKLHNHDSSVAYRQFFSLYITLKENNSDEQFEVSDIDFSFVKNKQISTEILQCSNATLNNADIQHIQQCLLKLNINDNINGHQMISMCSVATLIKLYSSLYSYIYIPVTLDYGRGDNFVHQTSLIIDCSGTIMYYEPYGLYKKYNKSYVKCIRSLFGSLNKVLHDYRRYNIKPVISDTYHSIYNLNEGIQNIIIKKNNSHVVEFNTKYNEVLTKIKVYFPKYYHIIKEKVEEEVSFDDKTLPILTLMSQLNNMHVNDDKITIYNQIYKTVMEIYCSLNSKTCVSITLIEMDKLFKIKKTQNVSNELKILYETFNIDYPNKILMGYLYSLLDVFKNKQSLLNIINSQTRPTKICKLIT